MVMDFRDSITVRRSIQKGTKIIDEPLKKPSFRDDDYNQQKQARLGLAGDLMIMSAKGTKKIRLSDLDRTKPTLPKGMRISTEKGTSTRKLE